MRIPRAFPLIAFLLTASLPSGTMRAQAQDSASLNPLARVEKASLKAFLERPLFDPSRRLPPPVSPLVDIRAPVLDEPPPSLQLLGVIRGVRDMAIVRRAGKKRAIVVRSGDDVDKWTVTVMPPIGIRLRNGNRTFEYVLFGKLNKNAAPVAVAPSQAASAATDAVGMPVVMPNSWVR